VAKIVEAAWKRCSVPSSMFKAITPWQLPTHPVWKLVNISLSMTQKYVFPLFHHCNMFDKAIGIQKAETLLE